MKAPERILCPIDFSDCSRHAVKLARTLARNFGAQLKVLHVVDTQEGSLWQYVSLEDVLRDSRRRAEDEVAAVDARADGAAVEVEIVNGTPYRIIVDRIEQEKFDLVVMGTHGHSEFEKLFLGSVTDKVAHLITAPLLTVSKPPEEKGETERPNLASGAADAQQHFRSIVMATDLGPTARVIADYALGYAQKFGARLTAVHVVSPPEVWSIGGAPWLSDTELERLTSEVRRERTAELNRLLPPAVRGSVETELLVQEGVPWEEVTDLARQRRADLVVVGAHGLGRSELRWLGSTCHNVMRASPCPVLIVRERA